MTPAIERALHELGGSGDAADDFDDEIDVRIVDQRSGIGRQQPPVDRIVAGLVTIQDCDSAHAIARAAAPFEHAALAQQPLGDARTDRAAPEYGDSDG